MLRFDGSVRINFADEENLALTMRVPTSVLVALMQSPTRSINVSRREVAEASIFFFFLV